MDNRMIATLAVALLLLFPQWDSEHEAEHYQGSDLFPDVKLTTSQLIAIRVLQETGRYHYEPKPEDPETLADPTDGPWLDWILGRDWSGER